MNLDLEQSIKASGELQNTNTWDISFNIPNAPIPQNVRFRCNEVSIPTQEIGTKTATIGRYKITQPGTITRECQVSCSFPETQDGETLQWQSKLSELLWSGIDSNNPTGKSKGAKNIKGNATIRLLKSDGTPSQIWELKHCYFFPKLTDNAFGNGDSDEVQVWKLDIQVTWWSMKKA